jgi:hypothetical protein
LDCESVNLFNETFHQASSAEVNDERDEREQFFMRFLYQTLFGTQNPTGDFSKMPIFDDAVGRGGRQWMRRRVGAAVCAHRHHP